MIMAHCNLCLLGSCDHLSLASQVATWEYRCEPPCMANFYVFVDTGFCHVAQAGIKLLSSSYLLASASPSAGITGMSHRAQPTYFK